MSDVSTAATPIHSMPGLPDSRPSAEQAGDSKFSYSCNQCGRCCRDQVITLSPHDVLRIARAAGISTAEAVREYTIRRGSILKFKRDGTCGALADARCTLHAGRPLACRLYPLGLQREGDGRESFIRLEPATGSRGIYGESGTIAEFLGAQGVPHYLAANDAYRRLLDLMRERVAALADFTIVEPREFWRVATREALAENNYDPNPLIDALFDADRLARQQDSVTSTIRAHIEALEEMIRIEKNPAMLAAAAVLLAVSLGYPPLSSAADSA